MTYPLNFGARQVRHCTSGEAFCRAAEEEDTAAEG
jgi:hypothetical protein